MATVLPGRKSFSAPDGRESFATSHSGKTRRYSTTATASRRSSFARAISYRGRHPPESFVFNQQVEFNLKEKAFRLSGDSRRVKRVDTGEACFKVIGRPLWLRDSKKLHDANGKPIYNMTEDLLTVRGRLHIADAITKTPIICLRKKVFIPMMGTGTIQAWHGEDDSGEPWLEVQGAFFGKDCTIIEKSTGRVLATIQKQSHSGENALSEKGGYVIRVEPGNNAALLIFFAVAADELYRDDGNREAFGRLLGAIF